MKFLPFCFVLAIVFSFQNCVPPDVGQPAADEIKIDFNNEEVQKLLLIADEKRSDLLLPYLTDESATLRLLAARAYSGIVDANALETLGEIAANDPVKEIREAAALAMGQSKLPLAEHFLIQAYRAQDTVEVNTEVRKFILEAVGKTGQLSSLNHIATVEDFISTDNFLLEGQASAIFQFAMRGLFSEQSTSRMVELVINKEYELTARQIAATYLKRFDALELSPHRDTLASHLSHDDDYLIQANLVSAVARSQDENYLPAIFPLLDSTRDYRLRVNTLRALRHYPYRSYRDSVVMLLKDSDPHVVAATADLIKENADSYEVRTLLSMAQKEERPAIQAKLYAGVLKAVPFYFANTRKRTADQIITIFKQEESPYIRAALINALAQDPINYENVMTLAQNDDHAVVKNAGYSAVKTIIQSSKFTEIFRTTRAQDDIRGKLSQYLLGAFESGKDSGSMIAAAKVINDASMEWQDLGITSAKLNAVLPTLALPDEIKAKKEISKAIAKINGTEAPPVRIDYNNPIDFNYLLNITDSSRVVINTNKGDIVLSLFPAYAPATVANFVKLIQEDYYDGLPVHRVVPNFVIQAGCSRGDGYGGRDYTIRTELARSYFHQEGLLGMASAGLDTEQAQWFITHRMAPHLDGRYTVFGKVESGMAVVHDLVLGDIVEDIQYAPRGLVN